MRGGLPTTHKLLATGDSPYVRKSREALVDTLVLRDIAIKEKDETLKKKENEITGLKASLKKSRTKIAELQSDCKIIIDSSYRLGLRKINLPAGYSLAIKRNHAAVAADRPPFIWLPATTFAAA